MNRTKLGIVSAIIIFIEAMIIGILTMLRTRYIIHSFGSETNAILQLAVSLTAYLMLFESGMSAAFQYKMYKPIKDNKIFEISSLFNGLKVSMEKVSIKMLIVSVLVSIIYSSFLQDKGILYLDVVSILIVMFVRIISPYMLTLHYRTLIFASEKKYISDIIECIKNSITIITELLLIKYTKFPLVFILLVQILYTFISTNIYKKIVVNIYGDSVLNCKEKNMEPVTMTKDILIHRISGLITSNTDAVLLSLFNSLNSVTIYTSFSTLINYPITLIMRIIDSMKASLAIKITNNDTDALKVFYMMISFELFCISVIVPTFIIMSNECIALWIGKEYQTEYINIILLGAIAMHKMFIPVIYAGRDAKGLFKETKKFSVIQAVINLIISLLLVRPLGLTGILIGSVVSNFLIIQPFNIKVISREVFPCMKDIYAMVLQTILLCLVLILIGNIIINVSIISSLNGWIGFVVKAIILGFVNIIISLITLYLLHNNFRILLKKLQSLVA